MVRKQYRTSWRKNTHLFLHSLNSNSKRYIKPKQKYMTTRELNSAIHKLPKMQQFTNHSINEDFKNEFIRLAGADPEFKYMDAESLRIMFRLNLRHRFYKLHMFGLGIKLKNDSIL